MFTHQTPPGPQSRLTDYHPRAEISVSMDRGNKYLFLLVLDTIIYENKS